MKKIALLLLAILIVIGCQKQEPLPENFMDVVKEYQQAEKYDSALIIVNQALEEKGDTLSLKSWKFYLLQQLEKYDEALVMALEKEKNDERKSPYRCMDIVDIQLKLNNETEALKWFEKAIDRGFKGYKWLLEDSTYAPIVENEKFDGYIETIKSNIGIGKQAKDFTVKLVDGSDFTLSEMKGKVVLVDFWATWCPPCLKEIPNLVELYNSKNDEGFEIIGISLDNKDKLEHLKQFLIDKQMEWKISYSGEAWAAPTAKMYGVNSIPSVWLVGKDGNLRYFDVHGEELVEKVNELLAE